MPKTVAFDGSCSRKYGIFDSYTVQSLIAYNSRKKVHVIYNQSLLVSKLFFLTLTRLAAFIWVFPLEIVRRRNPKLAKYSKNRGHKMKGVFGDNVQWLVAVLVFWKSKSVVYHHILRDKIIQYFWSIFASLVQSRGFYVAPPF